MNYRLINTLQDGTSYDISQIVSSIKWGGDIRQAARNLEIDLALSRDSNLPRYNVPLGSLLLLRNQERELIRTVVFDTQKSTSETFKVIGYDHLIYLLKSTGTYIFRGMSPEAITTKVCADFGIPVGSLPASGVTLQKLILRDMTIHDVLLVAWTEAGKRNGKKYMLKMIEGKLSVIEKAQQTVRWLITEGTNLMSANYSENLNDMKNKIVIVGDKDQVIAQVQDDSLIKQYGILQELHQESDITTGEAQTMAANLLKDLGKVTRSASLECLGLDDVEAGTAIEVQESLTGLIGTFYVDTDEHTVQNDQHTMSLKLNWTDEVATKDAPEIKVASSSSSVWVDNSNW